MCVKLLNMWKLVTFLKVWLKEMLDRVSLSKK